MSFNHALKWSLLSELAAKAIQPVVLIVLARLLTSEDFGVMTAAMLVIAFSQIFWEAGMGKALIQRQTENEEAANAAFLINITLGAAIAGLLYASAQSIADGIFQDARVKAVLQAMTLQILLGALSSVQTALLQKEMSFKKLFWVRFGTISLPGFASIPLALNGLGYWALVAGTLVGQIVQTFLLWQMSPWRPTLRTNLKVTKDIGKFGAWVGLTGLLSWFYLWADALVVSHFLGSQNLGLYRMAHQFSDLVYLLIFSPMLPVAYSYFSRISSNLERMQQVITSAIILIMSVALPLAVFIFIFSQNIERILFGEKWSGIGIIIGYLSLRQGFAWVTSLNGEVYRAMNKPQLESIVLLISLLAYVPVYITTAQIDLTTFAQARLALVILSMTGHLWLLNKILRIPLLKIYSKGCLLTMLGFLTALVLFKLLGVLNGYEFFQVSLGFSMYALLFFYLLRYFKQQKYLFNIKLAMNKTNFKIN